MRSRIQCAGALQINHGTILVPTSLLENGVRLEPGTISPRGQSCFERKIKGEFRIGNGYYRDPVGFPLSAADRARQCGLDGARGGKQRHERE